METQNKAHKLNEMAKRGYNVARFVSISKEKPNEIEYNWSTPESKGRGGETLCEGLETLLKNSRDGSVNIRSFSEESLEGNRFEMGKTEIEEIIQIVKENTKEGRHSLVNENIDVCDGGVSGVILRQGYVGVIEFSPEDTPRCVDKAGVCSLPLEYGYRLLETVYRLNMREKIQKIVTQENAVNTEGIRVEFSIHPLKEGLYREHIIIWEVKKIGEEFEMGGTKKTEFPNNFSKYIGDKAYGLTLAYILGLRVPKTTVISRNIAPYVIGEDTGEIETWIRTAPIEKEAGKYYTGKGWQDPFKLMSKEEEKGTEETNIAAILSQQAVDAEYSGGGIVRLEERESIVEGVRGEGDNFMLGEDQVTQIPQNIRTSIGVLEHQIRGHHKLLGDMTYEWVQDTSGYIWLVQMNQIKEDYAGQDVIVGGEVVEYIDYKQELGIDKLRELVETLDSEVTGVRVVGNIGVTSHIGDILRRAGIVSKIQRV